MSYMEARAEMPGENNSPVPIPRAQRVADHVHLWLAFLPVWDSNPQDADLPIEPPGKAFRIRDYIMIKCEDPLYIDSIIRVY